MRGPAVCMVVASVPDVAVALALALAGAMTVPVAVAVGATS